MVSRKKPYTVILVQARMGSTRLPGKVMKEILGRPLLAHLLERLKRCSNADKVVIVTSTNPRDQQIVDFCRKEGVAFFRGSELDVLDRYFQAGQHYGADVIVRITGDNPLVDPLLIDSMLGKFLAAYPKYDYLSNVMERTFPRGLDVEIFTMNCLEEVKRCAALPDELEHVTAYILKHPDRFTTESVTQQQDFSGYRWTVDTEDDFVLIKHIFEALYPKKPQFTTDDVITLLERHTDWLAINAHVKQKQGVRSHD